MSILSKVTLGFVAITALFFWYMAMRTLKTHQAWRTAHSQHEVAVEAAKTKLKGMMDGDPEKGTISLGKLQVALDSAMFGRGRAWIHPMAAAQVQPAANESAASFIVSPRFDGTNIVAGISQPPGAQPQPHQIEVNMVLNAFQGLDDVATGQYIGEFKVTAVDANNITLSPAYKPTGPRLARLQQAQGPWALYEVFPADMNELFAGLADQDINSLLPEAPQPAGEANDDFQKRLIDHQELIDEYKQDNKPVKPDDPPRWSEIMKLQVVVKFVKDQAELTEAARNDLRAIDFGENLVKSGVVMKVDLKTAEELVRLNLVQEVERLYQRKLRDYSYILREFHRRLPVAEDRIANLEKDLAYLDEANIEANLHLEDARKQETVLKQEFALVSKERDVVTQFHGTLQDRLNMVNAEIARLQQENQRLATQLAQRQLEAAESRTEGLGSRARLLQPRVPTALNSRL